MRKLDKKAIHDFNENMKTKYLARIDKDNIFGVGLTDSEFRNYIINILLGKDWYVINPLGHNQVNEQALYEILNKLCKGWQKL